MQVLLIECLVNLVFGQYLNTVGDTEFAACEALG